MSFGQITGKNTIAYYPLADANDYSGNGYNLTNYDTVAFSAGRFDKGADFGSSGTAKALQIASGIIGTVPTSLEFHFWFKLNNTSSANATARFWTYQATGAGTQLLTFCQYTLSGGNINISYTLGSGTITASVPIDDKWHWVRCSKVSTSLILRVDLNAAVTGSGSVITGGSNLFTIGNGGGRATSGWATISEFVISDSALSGSELWKHYTYTKGYFGI